MQRARAHKRTRARARKYTQTCTGALTTKITVIFVFNFFQIAYNLQTFLAHKLNYKCSSCYFDAPSSNLPVLQNRNLIISFHAPYLALQFCISPPVLFFIIDLCTPYNTRRLHPMQPLPVEKNAFRSLSYISPVYIPLYSFLL